MKRFKKVLAIFAVVQAIEGGGIILTSCNSSSHITIEEAGMFIQDGVIFGGDPKTAKGSLAIPDGVTGIGNGAFRNCSGLKSIEIPEGVTHIGFNAFSGCTGLKSITIPSSVTYISSDAFTDCTSLKNVIISEGVEHIVFAFNGCINLESVTIPSSTKRVDGFHNCPKLKTITVAEDNPSYTAENGVLYTKVKTGLIAWPSANGNITIPSTVEAIGSSAFEECLSLTGVTISEGVIAIERNAFQNCKNLKNITIPSSVKYIQNDAFTGCENLKSITIAEDNPNCSAENGIIYDDKNRTELTAWPSANGNITIPSTVETIETSAFEGCRFLTGVTIPESITEIKSNALKNCTNLKTITVAEDNPNYSAENGILYDKDKTELIAWPSANGNITISSTVETIGSSAFEECLSLTGVTISEGVIYIESNAFQNCKNLKNITIPSSAEDIDTGAFAGCENLKSITVAENNPVYFAEFGVLYNKDETELIAWPSANGNIKILPTVEAIGDYAFSGCTALTGVIIPNGVRKIGYKAFIGCCLTSIEIPKNINEIESLAFCSSMLKKASYHGTKYEWKRIKLGSYVFPKKQMRITCSDGTAIVEW